MVLQFFERPKEHMSHEQQDDLLFFVRNEAYQVRTSKHLTSTTPLRSWQNNRAFLASRRAFLDILDMRQAGAKCTAEEG